MNTRTRAVVSIGILAALLVGLFLIFPSALGFVEMAARDIRYFWWLILLVALAGWLIWAGRRRR